MAFMDWIKNRQAGQQQASAGNTQEQKPQTAKEMYSQQAAQEKAAGKAVEQIPEADKAKARELGERIDKATQHIQKDATSQLPSAPGGAASPQPMRQNTMNQDKSSPALSPTSAQKGTPATEKSGATPSNEPPAKPQEKPAQRAPQTLPRRPPSWER